MEELLLRTQHAEVFRRIAAPNSKGFFSAITAIGSWNAFPQQHLVRGVTESGLKG